MPEGYILKMESISKSFAGVQALDSVTLHVKAGEVHIIMGENGAGKSTLMKILAGMVKKDHGIVFIEDRIITINTPREALNRGISMIHQELIPVMEMTVAENIYLGREHCYGRTGIVNSEKSNRLCAALFKQFEITINPKSKMSALSLAEQQMVEIVKAVSYESRIIIMDEPTSALSDKEVAKLFTMISRLKARGVAILYISHKMEEIFRIADTITVLRDGRHINTRSASELNKESLIKLMVGRELKDLFPKEPCVPGNSCLEVEALSRKGIFSEVSFSLRQGEIVGFAGLMGAGRTEVMESVFGITPHDRGRIRVQGKEVIIKKPADALAAGMALITEDRKAKGLNGKGSVKENITLASLRDYCLAGEILQSAKERIVTDTAIKINGIKVHGRNQLVSTLSGGNQQKVVFAKSLLTRPAILILDEPTRGIDVGAKAEIYKMIGELVKQKKGVILISSELPELLGLCDRIMIMCRGRITGEFNRSSFDPEKIMQAAMNSGFEIQSA